MSTLIAVENQKGGCGKTTTTMNLAGGFQKAGYNVLVIDADPQASAITWAIARGAQSLPFDVMTARQVRGHFNSLLEDPKIDIILIDCPHGIPGVDEDGRFIRKVVRDADAILVPLRPSTLDFSAARAFVHYLVSELQPDQLVMVLINARQHTLMGRQAPAQAATLFAPIANAVVLNTTIGHRAPITEVSGSGRTIFDYMPKHEAALEYTNLTKEIIQCLHRAQNSQASALPSSPAPASHSPAESAKAA